MHTNPQSLRNVNNTLLLELLILFLLGLPTVGVAEAGRFSKRWVYVSSNLYVDANLEELERLLVRAQKAGYNGVLFNDYKTFTWWQLDNARRWEKNAQQVRAITRRLGMELVVCVFPFGYAGPLLWHDVNLASGMPVKNAPLKRVGDELKPLPTAVLVNGSFEQYTDHHALHYAFQDAPGTGSFIDHNVKKEGEVSIRFEDIGAVNSSGNGRLCQQIEVRPWQQYRIRIWMKTQDLTGDEIKLLVLGRGRTLQWQHLQVKIEGQYHYIGQVNHLSTDWVEQSVTFNSLDNETVMVYAGIWGGRTGKLWWDDWRIEAAPVLNVLRRDALPLTITGENGVVYEEGRDFERITDPSLGCTPWPGSYDTRHNMPVIRVTADTRIAPDEIVYLSCYHPVLIYSGQVNCSLSDPKVFALCRQQIDYTESALQPDGYFMSHDEIRCAGWEPDQIKTFESTGQLLAYNVQTCYQIIRQAAGQKPVYIWSDMFDPYHNARDGYYLVNNTLAGSWEGLAKDISVMKWGGGEHARDGLVFFAERGYTQLIAAYYDGNVGEDYRMWNAAIEGVDSIDGVMYTTWQNDFSALEAFASCWWNRP
jgi:hypothetical protein